jgi:hypothetical protein
MFEISLFNYTMHHLYYMNLLFHTKNIVLEYKNLLIKRNYIELIFNMNKIIFRKVFYI